MSDTPRLIDRKPLLTRLAPEMLKELKHLAIDKEVSINSLVVEAIRDLIRKHKNT